MSILRAVSVLSALVVLLCVLPAHSESGQTPIYQVDTPFIIRESGSYLVAEELYHASLVGASIVVYADDVTLDLGGNLVQGTLFSPGIYQPATNHHLVVKNGYVMRGIDADGENNRFENLAVWLGLSDALSTGPGAVVENCVITSNELASSSGALLRVGSGSRVSNCTIENNTGLVHLRGIVGGDNVTVQRCLLGDNYLSNAVTMVELGNGCIVDEVTVKDSHAYNWTNTIALKAGNYALVNGSILGGIVELGAGSILAGCTIDEVTDDPVAGLWFDSSVGSGSVVSENFISQKLFGDFYIADGSVMRDNFVWDRVNGGNGSLFVRNYLYDGVRARVDCFVADNYTYDAILVTNCCNRIDGNQVESDFVGTNSTVYSIIAHGGANLIVRNHFDNNVAQFIYNGSDDYYGTRVDQTTITSDQPWANVKD